MGYGAANAERSVYSGAPTPRKLSSVVAAIATALATATWIAQIAKMLAIKLLESSAPTQPSEKTAPAAIAAASPVPRPRPAEALALQNSEPSQAVGDRTLLQKISELLPARITLASLTPTLGLQRETPDLTSSGFDSYTAVYDISA